MRAAGRRTSGRSSARAATRSRCSIRRGRRRTASSAARRSSSRTRRRSPRSGRRACCRSRSAKRSARDRIRQWYGKLWLAPNALKRRALTDTVKGIYLPYWTFDAQADAQWTAEAGHYYYTTETYVEGGQTRTRQVRHVRWEPAAGRLSHFFDDDLVCASVGVHPNLLRGIEPFPDADAQALRPGLRRGLGGRALPDRPRRRGAARARGDGRQGGADVRAAGARRHLSQSRRPHVLFAADVQAHPGAGLAHDAIPTARAAFQCVQNGVTGADRGRVSEEPVEDRARSCSRCSSSSSSCCRRRRALTLIFERVFRGQ